MTTPTVHPARRGAALLTLLSLLALHAAFAQSALPPGAAHVKVTSALRSEFTASAGEVLAGWIAIENTGTAPAAVEVSQADFRLDEDGALAYEDAGSLPASNAPWIEVASRVDVPAGGSVDVPFTLRVPNDPDLHGTFWSLVQVEPVNPEVITREATEEAQVRTSIEVSFQYGVTVLTHIGEPAERKVLFEDPSFVMADDDGGDRLALTLHNPGTHLLAADLWLELYDDQGTLIARLEGGEKRLYPDAALRHEFDLGTLDERQYQAVVVADAGGDDVFGVRYTLDVGRP